MSWEKIWNVLEYRTATPKVGGWFHLSFWALSIAAGVLLCLWLKDGKKHAPHVVVSTAVLVILLEVYKLYHFGLIQGGGIFAFPWRYFPFQFCSTPMYVGFLTAFFPKGKVRDSLYAYLATFSVFAGLCVMVNPIQVFVPTLGINLQTMICHGSMLTVGIYLFGSGSVKMEYKTVLKALPVFAITASIAVVLNEWAHSSGITEQYGFNMFYFSRYGEPSLILYSDVQRALGVSNPLNLFIYVVSFILAAFVILFGAMGIRWLLARLRTKKAKCA